MFKIPCIILAGGKSSRMGEDKSLLPFKESKNLITYQYDKLSKLFTNVYISTKSDKFNIVDAKLLLDSSTIYSPMIALKAIFEKIKEDKVFIISVDTPFVLEETIIKLIDYCNSYDIIIARDEKKVHNLCGIFSKSILEVVNNCLKDDIHKINFLIKKVNSKELFFDNSEQFLNINTPEDYKQSLFKK